MLVRNRRFVSLSAWPSPCVVSAVSAVDDVCFALVSKGQPCSPSPRAKTELCDAVSEQDDARIGHTWKGTRTGILRCVYFCGFQLTDVCVSAAREIFLCRESDGLLPECIGKRRVFSILCFRHLCIECFHASVVCWYCFYLWQTGGLQVRCWPAAGTVRYRLIRG